MELKGSDVPEVLLTPLYDSVIDGDKWTTFLKTVTEVFNAHAAAIFYFDPGSGRTAVNPTFGFSEEMRRDFEQLTKFSTWGREISKFKTQGWYSGVPEDVLPADEYHSMQFFKDLESSYAVKWRAGAFILSPQGIMRGLTILRLNHSSPYSEQDKNLLQELVPHLARVFQMHANIAALTQRNRAYQHALDLMGAACLLLGADRRVMGMNRRAEALISGSNVLQVVNRRLKTPEPKEQHTLDACIVQACERARSGTQDGGSCATILRPDKKDLLLLSMIPYQSSISSIEDLAETPAAIIFITTLEEQAEGDHGLWHALFGLAPAECRVAELMKQGAEAVQISKSLNLKLNTVRYYQKTIYHKTGVSGQPALIRLLTRLPSSDE